MFDINSINKRYFNIKIGELVLDVEPPKIKTLKKIISLSKGKTDDVVSISEAIKLILSKNKSGYLVSDEIIDELDMDQYSIILTEYFKWISDVKNSPN